MVLPEDSSNALCEVLERISDSLEKNTDILNRIADHYDGVVPVMTRNAKRAESMAEEQDRSFGQQVKDIFINMKIYKQMLAAKKIQETDWQNQLKYERKK